MVKEVSQLSSLRNGIADNEKCIMCSGVFTVFLTQ
jgi:hypothetical protein